MNCSKCGNEVKNGDIFCKKCGEKIERIQNSKMKGEKRVVKIKIIYLLIPIIIALILLGAFLIGNGEPKNYEEIIESFADAMISERKMGDFIEKNLDIKGIVAWQEADEDSEKFKKEYKKVEKDLSREIDDIKELLEGLALENELDDYEVKVVNIDEPEQDEDNSKIYYISATLKARIEDSEYASSWDREEIELVFYKDKIVDIIVDDSSIFSYLDF